jgi:hypothetical protein
MSALGVRVLHGSSRYKPDVVEEMVDDLVNDPL